MLKKASKHIYIYIYMFTVVILNIYPTFMAYQCRSYVQTYTCVQNSETDNCGTI